PAPPLPDAAAAALCVAWAAAWSACRAALRRERGAYAARLVRAQAYCALAVLGGARLLLGCRRLPEDLLEAFGPEHQVLFAMAAGHWAVAIREDAGGMPLLGPGLECYVCHHAVALAGYLGLLRLRSCAAVGALGLIFELPVLLLNHRELALAASPQPVWLRQKVDVSRHWQATLLLFWLARGGSAALYVVSLVFWRRHIAALRLEEKLLYHGMAIFFSLLNYTFLLVLDSWSRHDLEHAVWNTRAWNVDADDVALDATAATADPQARALAAVAPEVLAAGLGEGTLLIAIDGSVYDVAPFLQEHPGGESVLRQWAAQDASEAFRRAKHSRSAHSLMARYIVGPLQRPPREYRIFEHAQEMQAVLALGARAAFAFAAQAAALACLPIGAAGGPPEEPAALLLLALALAAAEGALAAAAGSLLGAGPLAWTWEEHALALGLLGHRAGALRCARGPWPAAAPPALELGAWALLATELLLEWPAGGPGRRRLAATAALALAAWAARGRLQPGAAGPGELLAPLAMAWPLRAALQAASGRGSGARSAELVVHALQLAGLYGAALALALAAASPAGERLLLALWASPARLVGELLLADVAAAPARWFKDAPNPLSLLVTVYVATCQSAAFAARGAAFLIGLSCVAAGGLSDARWLSAAALVAHLAALAARGRAQLHEAALVGRFAEVPRHVVGSVALWDQLRAVLAILIWRLLVMPWSRIVGALLPSQVRLYACEAPFFRLGDNVALGVAMQYSPLPRTGEKPLPPAHFVCSASHLAQDAVGDIGKAAGAFADSWRELHAPGLSGLVACTSAVFPCTAQGFAKEVTLSAWASEARARRWAAAAAARG
ncbi:unnamed protein product, partial [Prorocentrum cordatum]